MALPWHILKTIIGHIHDDTAVLNLCMTSKAMCDVVMRYRAMDVVDVSNLGQISFSTFVILKKLCITGRELRLMGSSFLAPCFESGYDLRHIAHSFRNLRKVVISMASSPTSLSYLANLPASVDDLQLDRLLHPISEFKLYLPELKGQLQFLSLTRMFHFTKFDLVEILQHFNMLTYLDLTETERLTRGTVEALLTYCYNLQEFVFSHDMSSRDALGWLDIVYLDYQHVTFPDRVYKMCEAFKEIYDW